MTNEEKILEMLTRMQGSMDERFDKIDTRLDKLEAGQRRIRKDISEIRFEMKEGVWEDIMHLDRRISRNTEAIEQLRKAR